MNKENKNTGEWEVFTYTRAQAIADGILVPVGFIGSQSVVITANLFKEGYEDEQKRKDLVNRGLELLRQPDPEDTEDMKLRAIEKNIWVIWNEEGFTYMKSEDY